MESPRTPGSLIVGPLPCVKCLYDLSGIGQDQKCPECGMEVAKTLASPAAAALSDLARARRGLRLISFAMILGIVWIVVAQGGMAFLAFAMPPSGASEFIRQILSWTGPLVSVSFTVVSGFGWTSVSQAAFRMQLLSGPRSRVLLGLAWLFVLLYSCCAAIFALTMNIDRDSGFLVHGLLVSTLVAWVLRTILGFALIRHIAIACGARTSARVIFLLCCSAFALPAIIVAGTAYAEVMPESWQHRMEMEVTLGIMAAALGLLIVALGIMATATRRFLIPFAQAALLRHMAACGTSATSNITPA